MLLFVSRPAALLGREFANIIVILNVHHKDNNLRSHGSIHNLEISALDMIFFLLYCREHIPPIRIFDIPDTNPIDISKRISTKHKLLG